MELDELLGKYEIGKGNPADLHKDLTIYSNIKRRPKFSLRTEKVWLETYEAGMCERFGINFSTLERNIETLTQYNMLSGGRQ